MPIQNFRIVETDNICLVLFSKHSKTMINVPVLPGQVHAENEQAQELFFPKT